MAYTFTVESAGGVASKVRLGRHELLFDQPRSDGGEGRGPSPLAVLATTVAACAHYYVAAFLQGRDLPVDGLAVDISWEKAADRPARIGAMALTVRLPPGVPERHRALVPRVVEQCPAVGSMVHPVAVEIAVQG